LERAAQEQRSEPRERPLESGDLNRPFDLRAQRSDRIRLWSDALVLFGGDLAGVNRAFFGIVGSGASTAAHSFSTLCETRLATCHACLDPVAPQSRPDGLPNDELRSAKRQP
jgi:hypothetical protein